MGSFRSSTLMIIAVVFLKTAVPGGFAQEGHQAEYPQIKAALNEISAGQVQSDIEKLVSFHTRNTLSAQDAASIEAGRGIGAAHEWIKGQFEQYSRDCGGCLEVRTDTFTQPVSERVPAPAPSAPCWWRLRCSPVRPRPPSR